MPVMDEGCERLGTVQCAGRHLACIWMGVAGASYLTSMAPVVLPLACPPLCQPLSPRVLTLRH